MIPAPHDRQLSRAGLLLCATPVLAVSAALCLAIPKALLFAGFAQLGMPLTAFQYFRSTLNDSLLLFTPLIAIILALAYLAESALHRALRGTNNQLQWTVAATALFTLLVVAYRLNTTHWYPGFKSVQGIALNASVAAGLVASVIVLLVAGRQVNRGVALGAVLLPLLVNAAGCSLMRSSGIRFADVTDEVGLTDLANSLGVAWGDYNGDHWPDVFVANHLPVTASSVLYTNQRGRFSTARPLAAGDLHGPAWGDFDNDGSPELFVSGGNNTPAGPAFPNHLFRLSSGRFADTAHSAGVEDLAGRAWGAALADIDRDGFLDLLVVNRFTPNALFHNARDGTFRDASVSSGIADRSLGTPSDVGTICASWADYDLDGDSDLVTTAIATGISLYRNQGDLTFVEVARESGLVTTSELGAEDDSRGLSGCAWGDYDDDGDMDLYISAMNGPSGGHMLFENLRADGFRDVSASAGLNAVSNGRAALWADFDNDGDLDLYVVNEPVDVAPPSPQATDTGWNHLYSNEGNGTFRRLSSDASVTSGFPFVYEGTAATADFDNDGFLDIFIANQRAPEGRLHYLTRNTLLRNAGNSNNWLKIRLRGVNTNRDGLGSRLELSAGGRLQHRQTGTEFHTYAQSSGVVHFGVGAATVVDSLSIRWPSGVSQSFQNVPVNRTLSVTEPAASTDQPR